MIWLLIALFVEYAQLRFAQSTGFRSPYCGLGAVDSTNNRTALAPMGYRVLFPWLIALVEWLQVPRRQRLTVYEVLKIGFLALTLAAISASLGREKALILATLLVPTFYFDYWDWEIELLGLALALTGRVEYALIGGILLALSRETAPLVPVTYILISGDIGRGLQILSATLAVLLAVRLFVGRKRLYCERVMVGINWSDVRGLIHNFPIFLSPIFYTLAISAMTIWAIVSREAGPSWIVPLALLIAGWMFARAAETRVFAACLLWGVMVL